jgi:hypothetical protein
MNTRLSWRVTYGSADMKLEHQICLYSRHRHNKREKSYITWLLGAMDLLSKIHRLAQPCSLSAIIELPLTGLYQNSLPP